MSFVLPRTLQRNTAFVSLIHRAHKVKILALISVLLITSPAFAQMGTSTQSGAGASLHIPNTSMCKVPPSALAAFPHTWYIDPVNGKTVSAGGTGMSSATAWNSLQAVFTTQSGYTGPLLTTASGGVGPIVPGDQVLLMNGTPAQYGTVIISNINNPSFVTFAAAPGQTPILTALQASNVVDFVFRGISVQGLAGTGPGNGHLIQIYNSGVSTVTHDIVLDHVTAFSADNATVATWTQSQWQSLTNQGIQAFQAGIGGTYCIEITNSRVYNTQNSLTLETDNSTVDHSEFDHFVQDDVDYAGNNMVFTHNHLHDLINTSSGAHIDFMQGFTFTAGPDYHDILIDSNVMIQQEDANLPFTGFAIALDGGINLTDESWVRQAITNNIIAVGQHAILVGSCHDCLVSGNTMLLGSLTAQPTTNQGLHPSTNLVIRNNLVSLLAVTDTNAVVDHNIMMNDGLGSNYLPANGFFNTPGNYGNGNIMDVGGNPSEIVAFNVSTVTYNFNLISTAPARGAGVMITPTTLIDNKGYWRAPTHDVGALVYQGTVVSPTSGALLLTNGADNLFLTDGASNLCLTGSTSC
jgi:hypothetical protein